MLTFVVVQGNASRVVAWHRGGGGGGTPLWEPGGGFLGHRLHLRWSPPALPTSSAVGQLDFIWIASHCLIVRPLNDCTSWCVAVHSLISHSLQLSPSVIIVRGNVPRAAVGAGKSW